MNRKQIQEYNEFFRDEGFSFKGNMKWLLDRLTGYYICRFCRNNVEHGMFSGFEEGIGLPTFCKKFTDIRVSEVKYHLRSCKHFDLNVDTSRPPTRAVYLAKHGLIIALFLLIIWILSRGVS